MKFSKSIKLLAFLIITGITNVSADTDIIVGKQKSETCLGCHAIPGYNNIYPTYKVPKLGGQHSEYIKLALKSYQQMERKHNTMHANAKGLTDEDINQIAKYFESIE
tara:strand:+ start:480 stop:800 length:321 start_codon:yes stop_codon:yes gene_type:complete